MLFLHCALSAILHEQERIRLCDKRALHVHVKLAFPHYMEHELLNCLWFCDWLLVIVGWLQTHYFSIVLRPKVKVFFRKFLDFDNYFIVLKVYLTTLKPNILECKSSEDETFHILHIFEKLTSLAKQSGPSTLIF